MKPVPNECEKGRVGSSLLSTVHRLLLLLQGCVHTGVAGCYELWCRTLSISLLHDGKFGS